MTEKISYVPLNYPKLLTKEEKLNIPFAEQALKERQFSYTMRKKDVEHHKIKALTGGITTLLTGGLTLGAISISSLFGTIALGAITYFAGKTTFDSAYSAYIHPCPDAIYYLKQDINDLEGLLGKERTEF